MRDTELYQNLLGIVSPWTVDSVTMDVEKQRVDVTVSHPPRILFSCPECGTESPVFDHAEERIWRHLDSCQFFTSLHARVPRISCTAHGVRQVSVPWAEARGRFTKLFERLAIDVLKSCDVFSAAALLRISRDEAWRTCEIPSSRRPSGTFPRPPGRSSSTAFTSWDMSARRWTPCASGKSGREGFRS